MTRGISVICGKQYHLVPLSKKGLLNVEHTPSMAVHPPSLECVCVNYTILTSSLIRHAAPYTR